MDEKIRLELERPEPTRLHNALLKHCKGLVAMSRRKMADYYGEWDTNHATYKGERKPDEADRKASERGEPQKMVVPLSYAQIQTFIAFCFALFFQKERLFELVGMTPEDEMPARVMEGLLERDLEHSQFDSRLYQLLLDVARFRIGVIKTAWRRETTRTKEVVAQPQVGLLGKELEPVEVEVEVEKVKYLGNELTNVSPYRFFPDTRFPLTDFQKGEFCASESEMSAMSLYQLQHEGVVAGIDNVRKFTKRNFDARGETRMADVDVLADDDGDMTLGESQTLGTVLVTEVQVKLIPKKFTLEDGTPIGEEDYPVKFVVWIANDNRIIKAEPLNAAHDEFTYDIAQYNPDNHELMGMGLASTIDALQSVITWFINAHITSVRKVIDNRMIGVASKIEMSDITERRSFIRMKDEAAAGGIDRWIKQLDVHDVTAGHVSDAGQLQQLLQVVTGINENALGQFHSGRRSATEARNVNAAAAQRLRTIAKLIFKGTLTGVGRKMISNARQELDESTYVRLVGENADPVTFGRFKQITKADLVGNYDFQIFDGTLPTDRDRQAEVLQSLIESLIRAPQLLAVTRYDLDALIREVLELRGIRHPERFKLDNPLLNPEGVQRILGGMNGNGQGGAVPGEGPIGPPTNGAANGGQPGIQLPGLATSQGGQVGVGGR